MKIIWRKIYSFKFLFQGILYETNGKVEYKGVFKVGKYLDGEGDFENNLMNTLN